MSETVDPVKASRSGDSTALQTASKRSKLPKGRYRGSNFYTITETGFDPEEVRRHRAEHLEKKKHLGTDDKTAMLEENAVIQQGQDLSTAIGADLARDAGMNTFANALESMEGTQNPFGEAEEIPADKTWGQAAWEFLGKEFPETIGELTKAKDEAQYLRDEVRGTKRQMDNYDAHSEPLTVKIVAGDERQKYQRGEKPSNQAKTVKVDRFKKNN